MPELLKNVSDIALIFAVSALALVGVIFVVFLKPRLDRFDSLFDSHTKLNTRFEALQLKVDKFDGLHASHAALNTRFETLKVDENLHDLQNLKTEVAVLKEAEAQRDKKVRDAIESLSNSLKELERRIQQAVRAGDNDNLRNLLTLRVGQTETAYTLSKIPGGTKEERALDEWVRAKDELARFLAEEQRQRAG